MTDYQYLYYDQKTNKLDPITELLFTTLHNVNSRPTSLFLFLIRYNDPIQFAESLIMKLGYKE